MWFNNCHRSETFCMDLMHCQKWGISMWEILVVLMNSFKTKFDFVWFLCVMLLCDSWFLLRSAASSEPLSSHSLVIYLQMIRSVAFVWFLLVVLVWLCLVFIWLSRWCGLVAGVHVVLDVVEYRSRWIVHSNRPVKLTWWGKRTRLLHRLLDAAFSTCESLSLMCEVLLKEGSRVSSVSSSTLLNELVCCASSLCELYERDLL